MKLLIIGANSYLGARLYYDLSHEYDVTGTYAHTKLSNSLVHLDILDPDEIRSVFDSTKPDITIHTANNASAKWCDANPVQATALNHTATGVIIREVKRTNGKLVYISSFGARDVSNTYGKTKQASEEAVKQAGIPYVILRPSLILGYSPNTQNDRPFNRILKNLDANVPAVYDTVWKFQPTYIHHITQVTMECIHRDIVSETIHIACPELTSRFQSAYDILMHFGVKVLPVTATENIPPIITDSLDELKRLNLPRVSYKEMIDSCIREIYNRTMFSISNAK